jgi:hypothetical protein
MIDTLSPPPRRDTAGAASAAVGAAGREGGAMKMTEGATMADIIQTAEAGCDVWRHVRMDQLRQHYSLCVWCACGQTIAYPCPAKETLVELEADIGIRAMVTRCWGWESDKHWEHDRIGMGILVERVVRHEVLVNEFARADALRVSDCLCLHCAKLGKCVRAAALLALCKEFDMALAVTQCPYWKIDPAGRWDRVWEAKAP